MPCSEHKKRKKGDCNSCGVCKVCPPAPSCKVPSNHIRAGIRGKRPYNSIVKVEVVRVSERKKKQDKLVDMHSTSMAKSKKNEKLDTVLGNNNTGHNSIVKAEVERVSEGKEKHDNLVDVLFPQILNTKSIMTTQNNSKDNNVDDENSQRDFEFSKKNLSKLPYKTRIELAAHILDAPLSTLFQYIPLNGYSAENMTENQVRRLKSLLRTMIDSVVGLCCPGFETAGWNYVQTIANNNTATTNNNNNIHEQNEEEEQEHNPNS